jgi:hypothetical protein
MASKNMMNHYRQAERGFAINTLKYLVYLDRSVRNRAILELGSDGQAKRFSPSRGLTLILALDVIVGF